MKIIFKEKYYFYTRNHKFITCIKAHSEATAMWKFMQKYKYQSPIGAENVFGKSIDDWFFLEHPIDEYFVKKGFGFMYDITQFTKEEVRKSGDIYDKTTIIPFLRIIDIPYIEKEWNRIIQNFKEHYDKEPSADEIFSRYLSMMKHLPFKRLLELGFKEYY